MITGDGEDLTAPESVTDKAGNQTTAASEAVSIDRTAPMTTASSVSPWSNEDTVTVTLTPNDNLSGVAATYYTINGGAQQAGTSVVFSDEGVYTVAFWSVDVAGNIEIANSVTFKHRQNVADDHAIRWFLRRMPRAGTSPTCSWTSTATTSWQASRAAVRTRW